MLLISAFWHRHLIADRDISAHRALEGDGQRFDPSRLPDQIVERDLLHRGARLVDYVDRIAVHGDLSALIVRLVDDRLARPE